MTEAFLHYVWQHQLIDHGLTTTDGQPVVVLRPGVVNRDAGPDFFNAKLLIGGIQWAGNIEIHIKASDWQAHNHSEDPAYNNVVLHVVYDNDKEIRLNNGIVPTTVELKHWINPALRESYEMLTAPRTDGGIACRKHLKEIPEMIKVSWLDRMTTERIEAKAEAVKKLLDKSHGGWEQTCYWLMAHYFGGKVNGLAFELLAKATDQRLLARWKDNPQRVEALLMGQAGLLEGYFEDDYPRMLQADYEAIRVGAGLKPIDSYLWKFYCLRPSAFPTIRISQFAHLICESSSLFATLLEMDNAEQIEKLFGQSASEYWDTHYQFDTAPTKASTKRIGRTQAQLLIINAWVPLLFLYGETHGQQHYKDQATALLTQIKPEDNNITRRWSSMGMDAANAAESQAILHMENNYCNQRRCLECRIGYQILKHQ